MTSLMDFISHEDTLHFLREPDHYEAAVNKQGIFLVHKNPMERHKPILVGKIPLSLIRMSANDMIALAMQTQQKITILDKDIHLLIVHEQHTPGSYLRIPRGANLFDIQDIWGKWAARKWRYIKGYLRQSTAHLTVYAHSSCLDDNTNFYTTQISHIDYSPPGWANYVPDEIAEDFGSQPYTIRIDEKHTWTPLFSTGPVFLPKTQQVGLEMFLRMRRRLTSGIELDFVSRTLRIRSNLKYAHKTYRATKRWLASVGDAEWKPISEGYVYLSQSIVNHPDEPNAYIESKTIGLDRDNELIQMKITDNPNHDLKRLNTIRFVFPWLGMDRTITAVTQANEARLDTLVSFFLALMSNGGVTLTPGELDEIPKLETPYLSLLANAFTTHKAWPVQKPAHRLTKRRALFLAIVPSHQRP